jgi:hypothetical protein
VADEPGRITSRNILAVEGDDEKNFFDKLLRHMGIVDFDIRCVGGKTRFKDKLPALVRASGFFRADGSSSVEYLAIIRDKDQDDAFASIARIVQNAGLTPAAKHGRFSTAQPKVGIFILPGETIAGTMLEDLCLKTVENEQAMECVEKFASCIAGLSDPPKNMSKAKVQAFKSHVFLATQPEIVDSVGLGAQKGYWDFDSPCLDELKQFLLHLK